MILAHAAARDAAKEPDRVRMARVLEHRLDRAFLDEASGVEHSDARAHLRDDPEVVADEEHGRVQLGLELRHEVEHLCLHGRVEPGRGLVEDEERRVLRERHRDHRALLHSAGELMRVAVHDRVGVRDLYAGESGAGPLGRLVLRDAEDGERLRNLGSDPHRRVQRRAGVLVDHRHRARMELPQASSAECQRVDSGDVDRTGADLSVARQVADDGERSGRLSAARLADEPVRLAAADLERDAAEHLAVVATHAVDDIEIAKLERGGGDCGLGHRSSTCCRLSDTRFTATTSEEIASAGKSTVHHWSERYG